MATIDELVLRMTLDNAEFKKSLTEMRESLDRTRQSTEKSGAQLEEGARRMGASFARLRNEIVAVGAALIGFTGLSNFIQSTTKAEMSIGLLSKNIGLGVETLDAWGGAAKRFGGSAEATGQTFRGLSQQFQQFSLTGQSQIVPYLRTLGVAFTDLEGHVRPLDEIMLDLADRFSKMDPQRANAFGAALGLDQGTINLLIQGRQEVTRYLEEQRKLGVTTREDAEAGLAFQRSLMDIQQAANRLGQTILTELTPTIVAAVGEMTNWITQNREWLKNDIVENLKKLATGALEFAKNVNQIVQAIGGWQTAIEVLFGLWLGGKFLAVLANIVKIATALSIIPGSGVTAASLGALAALGIPLALSGDTPKEGPAKEEIDDAKKAQAAGPEAYQKWLDEHPNWIKRGWDFLFKSRGGSGGGPNVGVGPDGMVHTQDTEMAPEERAFLDALAGGESKGYYDRNKTSTAHDRYQFLDSTEAEVERETGLTGSDPVTQDRKGLYYASKVYQQRTGRDLRADLKQGGHTDEIAAALNGAWPSLPGGSQQNTDIHTWRRRMNDALQGYKSDPNRGQPVGPSWYHPGTDRPAPSSDPDKKYVPRPYIDDPSLLKGSQPGVVSNNNTNSTNDNSTKVDTNIGAVNIHTAATDSGGIARDLGKRLQEYNFASQANYGLA